jgi:hypothetical protein
MRRIVVFAAMLGLSVTVSTQSHVAALTLITKPSPLGLGQNLFEVLVKDGKGRAVADADVSLLLVMPADPKTRHPEMRTEGKLNNVGSGKYNGIAIVSMAGDWDVTIVATQKGKELSRKTWRLTAYSKAPPKK